MGEGKIDWEQLKCQRRIAGLGGGKDCYASVSKFRGGAGGDWLGAVECELFRRQAFLVLF